MLRQILEEKLGFHLLDSYGPVFAFRKH
jgi:hypothetical protein